MFRRLQDLFVRTVDRVENHPAPFSQYYFLFFAILAVRLALEFFSSHRLFRADDITHIGLWFVFIVMAFMVQLKVFSGEKMIKVAKLVITFFSIALTAPIIDLIVSGGQGAKMNYLSINSWADLGWAYITVGGSSLSRGATLGIRIEIILLLIASFNYIRSKTGRILPALLGTWCIYTILFLSGAVPRILGLIVDTFQLHYGPEDQSTLLFLLCLDLPLIFLAFVLHNPRPIKLALQAAPWGAILLALTHFALGIILATTRYPDNWHLDPTTLFWPLLLFAQALCFALSLGLDHNLRQAKITPEHHTKLQRGILLALLVIGAMISTHNLFTVAVLWGLLFLLYQAPLHLDRVPLLRQLLYALSLLTAALIGFATLGAPMVGFPPGFIFSILIPTTLIGIFTDLHPHTRTLIPWTENLSSSKRKRLIFAVVVLLLIVICLLPFWIPLRTTQICFLCLFALPPLFFLLRYPTRTQWIILSFIPIYIFLALSILYHPLNSVLS